MTFLLPLAVVVLANHNRSTALQQQAPGSNRGLAHVAP